MGRNSLPHAALLKVDIKQTRQEQSRELGNWVKTVEEEMKVAVKTGFEPGCLAQDRPGEDFLVPYEMVLIGVIFFSAYIM